MAQKPVLGKGLASLFPGVSTIPPLPTPPSGTQAHPQMGAGAMSAGSALPVPPQHTASNHDRHPGISLAITDEIRVNPYQPRREFDENAIEELAQSIRSNGIIQPLVVRKGSQGEYELIAGERRLRAAKKAGLKQVPVVIRRSTDREALEIALIENIQRQNLNCIDEALAYHQLMQDFSLTQDEMSQRVGKDRATIANFLRLLKLPEAIIDDLKKQILSFGHGKAILSLEDSDQRLRARAQIVEKHLSVREAEALVSQMKSEGIAAALAPVAKPESPLRTRLAALAQELTRHWSARVELKGSDKKGKIMIHYSSRQELDRILEAMQNK